MTYYLLGINGFIAKHFYISLLKKKEKVICLHHKDLSDLKNAQTSDIIVNFCGVNRARSEEEYEKGNHYFLHEILKFLDNNSLPFFMHISSYMVNGFENSNVNDLPEYQKMFINSKLNGEKFLQENYPNDRLCIIRPSNIYGYDCEPYYNNILVTLVYEKIINDYKVVNINSNCERNFLSVNNLVNTIFEFTKNNKIGIYNVVSDQNINLADLCLLIYKGDIPSTLSITADDISITKKNPINGELIVLQDNLPEKLIELEEQIRILLKTKGMVKVEHRNKLSQSRGDMVEISALNSKRLYMITLKDHSVRGNHYHNEQIEDFYIHKGTVFFMLAHKNYPSVIYSIVCKENDCITVNPLIIHTLVNDFVNQIPEIIITSTFPYIPNVVLDTVYVNIV